jgi:TRAP-type C4-dicarboxylate transport system substrate-binding protein
VPAQLPLANVGSNPALWKDSWTGSKAYAALYAQQPAMTKELDKQNVQLISAITTPTYYLLGRKVELHSLDQIKGMRIMSSGQIAVLLQSLGAQIVSISTPEGYEALQRGTVDGAVYGVTAAATYGIQTVVRSLWEIPVGGLPLLVVMNKDVWNSISKPDQQAILKIAGEFAKAFHEIYQVGGDKKSLEKFKAAGVKIVQPDQESLKELHTAAEKIWAQWAKEQDAAGRPGGEVIKLFVKLSEEYAAKNPYAKQ